MAVNQERQLTDSGLIRYGDTDKIRCPGGVAEWTKALVLKTSEVSASQGSNPCPSAKLIIESESYITNITIRTIDLKGWDTQNQMRRPTAQ